MEHARDQSNDKVLAFEAIPVSKQMRGMLRGRLKAVVFARGGTQEGTFTIGVRYMRQVGIHHWEVVADTAVKIQPLVHEVRLTSSKLLSGRMTLP